MTPVGRKRDAQTRNAITGLLWVAVALASTGCATDRFYAASLPPSLHAPLLENAQTVDLSRLAMAGASSELIDRGDVLDVSISAGLSADDTVTFPVRINDDGMANLPIIGNIPLAGLELEGAEAAITATAVHNGLYRSPHVTVTMKRQRMNRIMVIGAVENPGIYPVPRGSSD